MKLNNLLFLGLLALVMSLCSCATSQKPSERIPVGGGDNAFTADMSSSKVRVPFKRSTSGLAEVQVSLNGVPFNMIWDTGASITSISALELQNLAKQGKITLDDQLGSVVVGMADGSTTEEAVFNIHEIYIQGQDNKYLVLRNISAVVSANDEAPLLIGSNVIKNLPKHSFNEGLGVIEFDK